MHKQTWLDSIYKVEEKWAECYMRDVFSLGVRSTQLSESFNNALQNHLKSDFHILRFLMHFERTVEVKRRAELELEFDAIKNIPIIKMKTPMLVEASEVYTLIILRLSKVSMKDQRLHVVEYWMEITDLLLLLRGCMEIYSLRRSA